VISQPDGGWWIGRTAAGREGRFPFTCVELLKAEKPNSGTAVDAPLQSRTLNHGSPLSSGRRRGSRPLAGSQTRRKEIKVVMEVEDELGLTDTKKTLNQSLQETEARQQKEIKSLEEQLSKRDRECVAAEEKVKKLGDVVSELISVRDYLQEELKQAQNDKKKLSKTCEENLAKLRDMGLDVKKQDMETEVTAMPKKILLLTF